MKSTGIVREVDELGRVVIPKEIRNIIGFEKRTPVEILVEGKNIVIKKYTDKSACVFCSSKSNLKEYKNKLICKQCIDALK